MHTYAETFSDKLLKVMKDHCETILNYRINTYVSSIWSVHLDDVIKLCKDVLPTGTTLNANSCLENFRKNVVKVKLKYEELIEGVNESFRCACKDLRPVIDIYEVCYKKTRTISFNALNLIL